MSEPDGWKDALTHRQPAWPIGGFAPGKYMGKCHKCGVRVVNIDKRAVYCFPCAVEDLSADHAALKAKLRVLEAENTTLREAIKIVSAPLPQGPEE